MGLHSATFELQWGRGGDEIELRTMRKPKLQWGRG